MDKQLQVGVKAFIRNEKGQYLVLEKPAHKSGYHPQMWDIVGGRIDPGTDLVQNLAREIKEETGMAIDDSFPPKLLGAQDIILPSSHIVRLTYIAKAIGEVKISSEHLSFKWVTGQELSEEPNLDRYVKVLLDSGVLDNA